MEYFLGKLLTSAIHLVIALYWLVTIFVFWKIARAKWSKGKRLLIGLLVAIPLLGWPLSREIRYRQAEDKIDQRYAEAKARFDERCKSAGVKIHRTAEDVEGIFLMKLRIYEGTETNPQFMLNDPYGSDFGGEAYVQSFMWGRNAKGSIQERLDGPDIASRGYRYVELIHPESGERIRYEARMLTQKEGNIRKAWETTPCGNPAPADERYPKFQNCPIPITELGPRYGVTYDDISTREDREYWIAGSSLRVIDLQTGEVMAERVGYMMDPLQGKSLRGSQPWVYAERNFACPAFPRTSANQPHTSSQTRTFVEQVLKPKQSH